MTPTPNYSGKRLLWVLMVQWFLIMPKSTIVLLFEVCSCLQYETVYDWYLVANSISLFILNILPAEYSDEYSAGWYYQSLSSWILKWTFILIFDIHFDIQGQQFYPFCVRFQALIPLLFVHTVCRRAKLLWKCHNTQYHNKITKILLFLTCHA